MEERFPITPIDPCEAFAQLGELPQPPRALYLRGTIDGLAGKKLIAVVGSRSCTSYGKAVCRSLIAGLRGYPIAIISGLALGIDSTAHEAALDVGLPTVAIPGSGLAWRALYPAQHRGLAERILENGGALLSEYEPDTKAAPWTFPRRNRLMAGIADMTIVIEAQEKSGTLITARLATEYNKIVGAVPGPVTAPTSRGSNWLLKLGAVPITDPFDILQELGIEASSTPVNQAVLGEDEQRVFDALIEPKSKDALCQELSLSPASLSILISSMEIKQVVRETFGILERVAP